MFMLKSVKLSGCQVVTMSSCQVVKFDPWDMLNNFSFHVYAPKSLFIAENDNAFFTTTTSSCEFRVHRAGSQLKMLVLFQANIDH